MALMRLDKILSSTGEYSRSEAKSLIRSGLVMIGDRQARSGDEKADPEVTAVTVKGVRIGYAEHHYIMMNKPGGYLSATEDSRDKTVLELMEAKYRRLGLFPAGRLDKDTEGLLILTDDGDFCHNIITPGKKVPKIYYAEILGQLADIHVAAFEEGIVLGDGTKCRPGKLEILPDSQGKKCYITIGEGKFHQVKRMITACGCQVAYLKRVKIGGLAIDESLALGEYRELTDEEKNLVLTGRQV